MIVAGSSKEANGQYGYMTAAYAAATGHRLWLARYQGPGGASSTASAVAVTGTEVFVTGSAVDSSTLTDCQTVGLQG